MAIGNSRAEPPEAILATVGPTNIVRLAIGGLRLADEQAERVSRTSLK